MVKVLRQHLKGGYERPASENPSPLLIHAEDKSLGVIICHSHAIQSVPDTAELHNQQCCLGDNVSSTEYKIRGKSEQQE